MADHLGTTRDWIDNEGEVVDHAIFDSYGNRTNADTFGSAFQWTGVFRDQVTGLQWNRARWYNPAIHRWMSEDPIKDGFNWQIYVTNAPTMFTDPDGLEAVDLIHATRPENAAGIISGGLQAGDDGLMWFSTPDIAGKGASADATVQFKYRLDLNNVCDVPQAVEDAARKAADTAVRNSGLTDQAARGKLFGRTVGDYIANWVKQQAGGVFRRNVPNTGGQQYIVKTSAWGATKPSVTGISGAGANQAVGALGNASDEAAALAASQKWGNRVRFAGRVGGRLLIVVGIGNSAYQIYSADNKAREVAKQVGGWAGACAGAKYGAAGGAALGAYIAGVGGQAGPQVLAPEEIVTVPIAGGIGGLLGGFGGAVVGWWSGSTISETVYDWIFQEGIPDAGAR